MGQKPTEEELFQMISEVDENMPGTVWPLRFEAWWRSFGDVASTRVEGRP